MISFAQIIEDLGGPIPFSKLIGVTDSHARTMKARNSVPVQYWPKMMSALREEGKPRTLDELISIQPHRKKTSRLEIEEVRA